MCRHVAYLGPPIRLSALVFDPPHSLAHQAYAPRDMRRGGTVNADGFGVGWYPADGGGAAVRYRRSCPLWADGALPALASTTVSGAVLGAARAATRGMPVVETAAAPFTDGRWLFSHNGAIEGWPDTAAGLAATLPTRDLLTMDAPTDASLLWALLRARLRAGQPPAPAVRDLVVAVSRAAPGSRLNLLLMDSGSAVATTVGHSLWTRSGAGVALIASEPLDERPDWRPVPEGRLVTARSDGTVEMVALPSGPDTGTR